MALHLSGLLAKVKILGKFVKSEISQNVILKIHPSCCIYGQRIRYIDSI